VELGFAAPPEWTAEAACLGRWDLMDGDGERGAKALCARCPVRSACLEYALGLEGGESVMYRQGIFGGLDATERFDLAMRRGIRPTFKRETGRAGEGLCCIQCGGPMADGHEKGKVYCHACHPARRRQKIKGGRGEAA
jgi:hypothetical protein